MCVHTAHCCAYFGCKYGQDKNCPVWLGLEKQQYGYWDGGDGVYEIPSIPPRVFRYRRAGSYQYNPSIYVPKLKGEGMTSNNNWGLRHAAELRKEYEQSEQSEINLVKKKIVKRIEEARLRSRFVNIIDILPPRLMSEISEWLENNGYETKHGPGNYYTVVW